MAPGKTWAQIAAGNKSAAESAACVGVVGSKSGTDTSIPSKLPSLLSTHATSVTEAPCPRALSKTQVEPACEEEWCMVGAVVPPAPGLDLPEPSSMAIVRSAPGLAEPEPREATGAPMEAVRVRDDGAAPTDLEDTQTATCVSESAEPLRDDMSSTAASERERTESCILCSGSGLLCDGLLADACPLCESGEKAEATHDRSSSSTAESPKGVERSPANDVDLAYDEAGSGECLEDAPLVPRTPALHVVSETGTKMTAPPGIGPPGIWIWPHDDEKKGDAEKTAASGDTTRTVTWPQSPVDSVEVEFVGKVARCCFGPEFMKMDVSWAETWVEGKLALSIANVQLHLEPTAPPNLLAPLVRLQSMLNSDQKFHHCQIFRMDRSSDDSSMHITCAQVSTGTCWDVLKSGYCPRTNCTWEHPAPSVMSVSVAGGPATKQTPLASLMPKLAADRAASDKAADFNMFPPSNVTQINIVNFDEFTDSSESEDM